MRDSRVSRDLEERATCRDKGQENQKPRNVRSEHTCIMAMRAFTMPPFDLATTCKRAKGDVNREGAGRSHGAVMAIRSSSGGSSTDSYTKLEVLTVVVVGPKLESAPWTLMRAVRIDHRRQVLGLCSS